MSTERRRNKLADPCWPGGAVVSCASRLVLDKSKAYNVSVPFEMQIRRGLSVLRERLKGPNYSRGIALERFAASI